MLKLQSLLQRSWIIQGGMGVWVSNWMLAREVSLLGELGVVSGTALHIVFSRTLQLGDPGGHLRRVVDAFPYPEMAMNIFNQYFIPGGKGEKEKFKEVEKFSLSPGRHLVELLIVSNFAEVFLAKEGHAGFIGINFLEKIQPPHIYSIYGAMLAGVDFIISGAGMPIQFPLIMEKLAVGDEVEYKLDVTGAAPGEFVMRFNPKDFFGEAGIKHLDVPDFLPIISSTVLARRMAKELKGKISAFIIENYRAAGHNAPPRNKDLINERGEPIYGEKDKVDIEVVRALGIPFFLAGSYAHPEKFKEAVSVGAVGIQAGSIFALCNKSGLRPKLRADMIALAFNNELDVFTDRRFSVTGYPFKVARVQGTLSEESVYNERTRVCDLGILREMVKAGDGEVMYRCPGGPVDAYLQKGGKIEETVKRGCLCNCLTTNVGFLQVRSEQYCELPLATIGDDVSFIRRLITSPNGNYGPKEAIDYIRGNNRGE